MSRSIGVISDTHGLLRPQALDALADVEMLLHAGDLGDPALVEPLRSLAPLRIVRGNVDHGGWARALPWTEVVEIDEWSVYMIHDLGDLELDPGAAGMAAVIYGHSHRPLIEWRDGVLFLNPGSAGPRRFRLPVTVARIEIAPQGLVPRLIELDV